MLQISALRYNWDIVHYIIDLLSKGPRIDDTQWTEVFGVRADIFWAPNILLLCMFTTVQKICNIYLYLFLSIHISRFLTDMMTSLYVENQTRKLNRQ